MTAGSPFPGVTGPSELLCDTGATALWRTDRRTIAAAAPDLRREILGERARWIRRLVVSMIGESGGGHIGGDLSVADILAVLFYAVLDVRPDEPGWVQRDRFILSKGHSAAALYASLALSGFFEVRRLREFLKPLSPLSGHPNRATVPGVETCSGSLGHGLPVAVGAAIGLRLQGLSGRTYVITGDGEMQEGSNWEALMAASHHHLEALTLIIDRNRLQQGAETESINALEPLHAKLTAFGWEVRVVDGHDHEELLIGLRASSTGRPVALIANTVKGKGLSFVEGRVEWHHRVPTAEQVVLALAELV